MSDQDNATSIIYGFDMSGNLLDWLDTELPAGCLMGMTLDAQGNVVTVDGPANRVVRISAK